MGSEFSTDKDIGIFMQLDKPYYIAGQYVSGNVFIEAKRNRQYVAVQVKLTGKQKVQWINHRQKKRRVYRNQYRNYDNTFTIYNFKGYVPIGQYSFPFSFLLPSAMCSSIRLNQQCHIRYTLSAMLTAQKSGDTQMYKMPLNIFQPPRIGVGATNQTRAVNSKCCRCCMDYGTTQINLKLSKNYLKTGQNFFVSGKIDNTKGSQTISNTTVILDQRVVRISSNGVIKNDNYEYNLLSIKKLIKGKKSEDFAGEVRIPPQLRGHTAIGKILAKYFVVGVKTQYGCCAQTASIAQHVIIHNQNPQLFPKKVIPKPDCWTPKQYPLVVCNQMKPFINNRSPGIPYYNLKTQNKNQPVLNNPQGNMMMMHNEPTMMDLQADYHGQNTNQYYNNQNFTNQPNPYQNQMKQFQPNHAFQGNINNYDKHKVQQPIQREQISFSPDKINQLQQRNNYQNGEMNQNNHNYEYGMQPRFNTDGNQQQNVLPRS